MIAYAISDPSTLHFDQRLSKDLERFSKTADWLLYRDKNNPSYPANAHKLVKKLQKFSSLKFLIHDDDRLAKQLGAAGVHFSSQGIVRLEQAKKAGLFTVASCHSVEEAELLAYQGIDAVTLSPVFLSPGKGKPLGLSYLRHAVECLSVPVIALGGIVSYERMEHVKKCGAFGFASIRYFS